MHTKLLVGDLADLRIQIRKPKVKQGGSHIKTKTYAANPFCHTALET